MWNPSDMESDNLDADRDFWDEFDREYDDAFADDMELVYGDFEPDYPNYEVDFFDV